MAAEPSKGMVFSLSLKVGLWRASDGTRQHAPAARAAHHRGPLAMGVSMKKTLSALALAVIALAAYLRPWPVPLEPVAFSVAPLPGYAGPHAPNQRLAQLQHIDLKGERGAENVAIGPDGKLYTAVASKILRMNADGSGLMRPALTSRADRHHEGPGASPRQTGKPRGNDVLRLPSGEAGATAFLPRHSAGTSDLQCPKPGMAPLRRRVRLHGFIGGGEWRCNGVRLISLACVARAQLWPHSPRSWFQRPPGRCTPASPSLATA
jgi:hypothetical protein